MEHAIVVTKGAPVPTVALLLQVADGARAQQTLDALRAHVPDVVKTISPSTTLPAWSQIPLANGVTGWQLPLSPQAGVVYGVDGKLAIIGTLPDGVKQIQEPLSPLSKNPDFVAATTGMPDQVTGLAWLNVEEGVNLLDATGSFKGNQKLLDNLRPLKSVVAWGTGRQHPHLRGVRDDPVGRPTGERGRRGSLVDSAVAPPPSQAGPSRMRQHVFTSESVTEGHPDKIADQISDGVLDAVMRDDPYGRVACETLVTTGQVVVAGEISTSTYVDIPRIARDTIRRIGYTRAKYGFDADTCGVSVAIDEQSPDIAQGVDEAFEVRGSRESDRYDAQGAGDQGLMFGYATDETPGLMPLPITLAHRMCERLAAVRRDGMPYLRPDGKSQVTVRYEDGRPDGRRGRGGVHAAPAGHLQRPPARRGDPPGHPAGARGVRDVAARDHDLHQPHRQVRGGRADGRLRAHRTQDHRGHLRRHGPSRRRRVQRQGPVQGRPLGLLRRALGGQERGGGGTRRAAARSRWPTPSAWPARSRSWSKPSAPRRRSISLIEQWVQKSFDLRPAAIIDTLDLRRPIYQKTAAYGHFGRSDPDFTWERTDVGAELADRSVAAEA